MTVTTHDGRLVIVVRRWRRWYRWVNLALTPLPLVIDADE